MKISIELNKTLEENAAKYFEKAKKARGKIEGAENAIADMRKKLEKEESSLAEAEEKASLLKPEVKWYHKYRWSFTRNGLLLVAGTNAASNEVIVKKQTEANDVLFHTDMAGSPFTVLKGEFTEEDLEDGALLTACYSRAWGKGMASIEVFHVNPDQVSKEAQAGESLPQGAFMIRGETKYHNPSLELGIGVIEREGYQKEVFVGSKEACKANCSKFAVIIPGDKKTSDVAKVLVKKLGGELDAFVKAIPGGGSKILK